MFNRRERLEHPCPNCSKGPNWVLIKMIDSAGKDRYPYICNHCKKRTQLFERKEIALKVSNLSEEVIVMPQREKSPCERCGKYSLLEKHHWAPFKYFDDADKWPTSNLCRECHVLWHQKMTGDLVKN